MKYILAILLMLIIIHLILEPNFDKTSEDELLLWYTWKGNRDYIKIY